MRESHALLWLSRQAKAEAASEFGFHEAKASFVPKTVLGVRAKRQEQLPKVSQAPSYLV